MNKKDTVSRRDALKAIGGTTLATAIAGCSSVIPGGESQFDKDIETVTNAIVEYDNNVEGAYEDGFTHIIGPGVPGMGWHITHPDRVQRGLEEGFRLDEPVGLFYDNQGNLGGAEYSGPAQLVSQSPDLIADESDNPSERWTGHDASTHPFSVAPFDEQQSMDDVSITEMMNQAHWAELFPADDSIEVGQELTAKWGGHEERETRVVDHVETHPNLRSLHIWCITENPDGIFNPTSPDFAQDLNEIDGHTH